MVWGTVPVAEVKMRSSELPGPFPRSNPTAGRSQRNGNIRGRILV